MKALSRYVVLALALSACGGEDSAPKDAPKPAGEGEAAAAPAPAGSGEAAGGNKRKDKAKDAPVAEAPLVNFSPDDFVESDKSRDPFRDYASLFRKTTEAGAAGAQDRKVKAAKFALDELKLVGIITRSNGRAMLVDPNGFGWILYTGDFVGKAESVNTGGAEGQEIQVNWRVDRIQPTDVTFVREDSLHPQVGRTTRKLPLYPGGDQTTGGRGS